MGAGQHPRNRLCQPAPKGDDEKQRDRPAPRHPGGVARHHRGPPQRDHQLPGEPPPAAPGQRHWAEGSWLLCVAPHSPCLCHGDMGPGMNEGRKGPGRLQTRSLGWTGAVPAEHTEARGRPVGLSLREKEARTWALGPQAGEALCQCPRCYPPPFTLTVRRVSVWPRRAETRSRKVPPEPCGENSFPGLFWLLESPTILLFQSQQWHVPLIASPRDGLCPLSHGPRDDTRPTGESRTHSHIHRR